MFKTVLVVDDSKLTRMMICKIISTHHPDWELIEADSGQQALEKIDGKKVDIMTLDMNMPGMTGLELGGKLRIIFPKAHISLVTANIQEAIRQKVKEYNIFFVPKPISEDKIMGFINSVI